LVAVLVARALGLAGAVSIDGLSVDETCRLEPIDNPFGPKLLPMSPI
jgi:hypothetical protein